MERDLPSLKIGLTTGMLEMHETTPPGRDWSRWRGELIKEHATMRFSHSFPLRTVLTQPATTHLHCTQPSPIHSRHRATHTRTLLFHPFPPSQRIRDAPSTGVEFQIDFQSDEQILS